MQTLKNGILLLAVLVLGTAAHTPALPEETKWISLNDAAFKMKGEKRPILIDLYTDWCGWCKVMDKKTYSNKNVGKYLSDKYYAVKLKAEGMEPIQWNGKTYKFNDRYRTNDFAIYLTQGQLSYPTTVILPSDGSAAQAIPGYMEPKEFELVLRYFGDGHYGKMPFDQFKKGFKSSW